MSALNKDDFWSVQRFDWASEPFELGSPSPLDKTTNMASTVSDIDDLKLNESGNQDMNESLEERNIRGGAHDETIRHHQDTLKQVKMSSKSQSKKARLKSKSKKQDNSVVNIAAEEETDNVSNKDSTDPSKFRSQSPPRRNKNKRQEKSPSNKDSKDKVPDKGTRKVEAPRIEPTIPTEPSKITNLDNKPIKKNPFITIPEERPEAAFRPRINFDSNILRGVIRSISPQQPHQS